MMVLKCDRKMSIEQMCKQFGVLEKETETFLSPMLQSGLVTMNGELELTRQGEEVLAKLWFTVERTEKMLLSDFTTEEAGMLMAHLRHIQEQCVRIMSGNESTEIRKHK
jgi:TrmH family RNA methyltransferase